MVPNTVRKEKHEVSGTGRKPLLFKHPLIQNKVRKCLSVQLFGERNSSVSVATGYELDGRGKRLAHTPQRPDRLSYPTETEGSSIWLLLVRNDMKFSLEF